MKISHPAKEEYPEYFGRYIAKVTDDDLLKFLKSSHQKTQNFIKKLKREQLNYRYAPGKWTIKEIMSHMCDGERVFAYRAMCFARMDKTNLPSFDENSYAEHSNAQLRNISDIMKEFSAVRQATIELFRSLDAEALAQIGTANQKQISVKALGYVIAGHEVHHMQVIHEKYLKK